MEFYLEDGKQLSPNCSTLVLPALSIGNVGQLAVDLLISSLKRRKIGYLDEPNVLPCVGNDAYSPSPLGKLALPVEAYESSSSAMTLVQQRSPVVKGTMIEYAKNVASFAAANGKNHVIILSSLDFGRWKNIDMSSGLQIYYLSSSNVDGTDADCETLGWNRLQDYDPAQRTWKYLNTLAEQGSVPDEDFSFEELEDEDYYPSLPFAALFSCFKAKGLKVTCLLCYCSEGDNIPEAFHLAEANKQTDGVEPQWITWKRKFLEMNDVDIPRVRARGTYVMEGLLQACRASGRTI
ncbi:UNVERIFIED_CONTAM: Proteasome assembly chaperone 2 [Sesamum angustifolium]|uniref:Proteasome assembly chaperone 2 n=1 Tax=Sesamum angustifolium TaxID=2727405 RepID=A0AAW2P098_9LAMI